jgi:hypothetical protein
MEELRDFGEDIKLNKFKLHIECEKHSGIYHYYCNLLSESKAELDDEKDKLDFMESEFELIIRKDKEYENIKVTEGSVKAFLKSDRKLEKQRKITNKIKKRIYHLESAVKALEHKKNMIGHLVNLFTMRYYSEPKDSGKMEKEDLRDKTRKNMMKRR